MLGPLSPIIRTGRVEAGFASLTAALLPPTETKRGPVAVLSAPAPHSQVKHG